MEVKVYVIHDREAIEYIEDNDIDGFRDFLEREETFYVEEPEVFQSEREALAYCSALCTDREGRSPVDQFPLRSSESYDLPFIEALENC